MIEQGNNAEHPDSSNSKVWWGIVFTVITVGLIAGYGLGTYQQRFANPVTEREAAPDVGSNLQPAEPADEVPEVMVDTARQTVPPTRVDTVYVVESSDSIEPGVSEGQRITPPDTPPEHIQPRPSDPDLIEMLYGRRLRMNATLVGDRAWIVEPGEVTEFSVIGDWMDPAQESWGVHVKFVAQANGQGIRASGILRYYGDGTEGNGYAARDFLLEHIERVGQW